MSIQIPTPSEDEHIKNINSIAQLDDDATVTAKEAALYLRCSDRTLGRMRENESGPDYIQPTQSNSKARNQKITYTMRDLRHWRESNKISSTMKAAEKRGLTFVSLADLLRPEPFWLQNMQNPAVIVGHAKTVIPEKYAQLWADDDAEIDWMSLDEVLRYQWIDLEQRDQFDRAYEDVFTSLLERNKNQRLADKLNMVAPPTPKKPVGRGP